MPLGSFLYTPIQHREQHVGNIYLADKEGEAEFSADDEETLSLFASQAAMAIANARRLQDEQRARADLETADRHLPGRRRSVRRPGRQADFNQP